MGHEFFFFPQTYKAVPAIDITNSFPTAMPSHPHLPLHILCNKRELEQVSLPLTCPCQVFCHRRDEEFPF